MTTKRIRYALAGGVAIWMAFSLFVVPHVIRWVYAGSGPASLGRVMGGRAKWPIERYLTVVIVTSDHGEEFGEHRFVGHGRGLHFPVLHVPCSCCIGPHPQASGLRRR